MQALYEEFSPRLLSLSLYNQQTARSQDRQSFCILSRFTWIYALKYIYFSFDFCMIETNQLLFRYMIGATRSPKTMPRQQLLKQFRNFHDASTSILNMMSQFTNVNTLFIAKNDQTTNQIVKVLNHDERLLEEGGRNSLREDIFASWRSIIRLRL
ncbi:hypothetical protein ACEQPO_02830 [Bacillus sp. SL00103]